MTSEYCRHGRPWLLCQHGCAEEFITSSASLAGYESIHIEGNQAKKIRYLKNKGGRLLSAVIQVQMPDKSIASIDDWGRVTWVDS